MTKLARESGNKIETIQVVRPTTMQEIAVDAAESVAFLAITGPGEVPDASAGVRWRISPDFAEYFKVVAGERVSASGSATEAEATNAIGAGITVLRVFYDATAGKVEIAECA